MEAAHLGEQEKNGDVERHEPGDRMQDGDGGPLAEGRADGEERQDPGDVRYPDQQSAEREPGESAKEATFDEVERKDRENEEADQRVDARAGAANRELERLWPMMEEKDTSAGVWLWQFDTGQAGKISVFLNDPGFHWVG